MHTRCAAEWTYDVQVIDPGSFEGRGSEQGELVEGDVSVDRDELEAVVRELDLWSASVPEALALAVQVHETQRRAGGGPYLEEHVYPITVAVARFLAGRDRAGARDAVVVALLHDTIEDSTTVTGDLIEARFGHGIARRVNLLTKPEKRPGTSSEETEGAEERYVRGIREADFATRAIKVLDRLNNLAAVHQRDRERRRRYLDETRQYYLDLAKSVDLSLLTMMEDLLERQERRFQQEPADDD